MADVVNLASKKLMPAGAEPNALLVQQLEIVLDRARKGYLLGVCIVTCEEDCTGAMRVGDQTYAMIGRMQECIKNTLDEFALLDEVLPHVDPAA